MRYWVGILIVVFLLLAGTANGSNDYAINSGLVCIHHWEGAWNANTGNGYYGGLQMNRTFMDRYGYMYIRGTKISFTILWGTADNWPVWAQMLAGRHGYRENGWYPWPNTARRCGLL